MSYMKSSKGHVYINRFHYKRISIHGAVMFSHILIVVATKYVSKDLIAKWKRSFAVRTPLYLDSSALIRLVLGWLSSTSTRAMFDFLFLLSFAYFALVDAPTLQVSIVMQNRSLSFISGQQQVFHFKYTLQGSIRDHRFWRHPLTNCGIHCDTQAASYWCCESDLAATLCCDTLERSEKLVPLSTVGKHGVCAKRKRVDWCYAGCQYHARWSCSCNYWQILMSDSNDIPRWGIGIARANYDEISRGLKIEETQQRGQV